jgi:hypothetical protein
LYLGVVMLVLDHKQSFTVKYLLYTNTQIYTNTQKGQGAEPSADRKQFLCCLKASSLLA